MTKSNIKKYKKKPVVIEALEWTGENFEEVKEFCKEVFGEKDNINPNNIPKGSYITIDEDGYVGICGPTMFKATYEEITD